MAESKDGPNTIWVRRHPMWLVGIVILGAICGGSIMLVAFAGGHSLFRGGIGDRDGSERIESIEELLATTSDFPSAVEIRSIEPIAMHGATDRVIVEIYLTDSGQRIGIHEIEQWAHPAWSEESFNHGGSDTGLSAPPCGVSSNLEYSNSSADRFCSACSAGGHCRTVVQYGEYVNRFYLDLNTSGMTIADFITVIRTLHERTEQYVH